MVAHPAALDRAVWPAGCLVMRIAPDDVFAIGADAVEIDDPHAIIESESMFSGVWLDRSFVEDWIVHNAEWRLPDRDGVSQGMVAALPVKVLVQGARALVMVPASFAHELESRL